MSDPVLKRASLAEIRRMKDKGELYHSVDSVEGEPLGAEFWSKAEVHKPGPRRSVHLKLDSDVFDFFFSESHGKGHIRWMQNVLKAYSEAHKRS